ncbi:MAG: carbohydrate kinase [Pseudomonadota bacterium]
MILCCGEALIDMIPAATVDGVDAFVPRPGGGAFNTAIALGRLGVPVGLLSGLSGDMFGAQLRAELKRSAVSPIYAIGSDRPTTLAFVRLVEGQAAYAFFDENTAGRMIAPSDVPTLGPEVEVLCFGGISLAAEPGADTYLHLAAREAGGKLVKLDPNIRPGLIPDPKRYRARLERMLRLADIVRLSDVDLAWLIGGEATEEAVRAFAQTQNCLVIVTRGGQGATAVLRSGAVLDVPAVPVQVADTVGAGDAFGAGVLAALREQGCLTKTGVRDVTPDQARAALAFAARVAAATVTRPGADPPFRRELG